MERAPRPETDDPISPFVPGMALVHVDRVLEVSLGVGLEIGDAFGFGLDGGVVFFLELADVRG